MAGEHVEQREDVYYIVGTRVSLDSIVYAFREGCSPEIIHEDFEGLTLPHRLLSGPWPISTPTYCNVRNLGTNWSARGLRVRARKLVLSVALSAVLPSGHPFRKAREGQPITCSETVPSETSPGGDREGKAWFQTMVKYEVIIYWSAEDEVFVAEVPELPGCAAHGATQESALGNAQDAIRLWIDTAKEFGDPVPEPKGAV